MVRARLTILILLLVASQLVASGFLLWTIENARYLLERRNVSYQQVDAYIGIADAARSHLQRVRQAANGDFRSGMLAEGMDQLQASVDRLKTVTEQERDLVHASDKAVTEPDAQRLAAVQDAVNTIVQETVQFRQQVENGPLAGGIPAPDQLTHMLSVTIRQIIGTAIIREQEEARRADAGAAVLLSRLGWLAVGVTVFGILLGAFGLYFLTTRVREPMKRLMQGVKEFTQGRLGHRTDLAGQDEFAQLGQALDTMAGQLEAQREELVEARDNLAETVAARTAELADANQRLRRTDAMRREFLANISHELRTPITVIRGEADVTLRGGTKSAGEYRDALGHIVSQAGRLASLVDDLLLIARAGAGALTLNREAVPLKALLTEARGHALVLGGPGTAITIEGPADLMAEADSDRLMQLFMILLDNAVRYAAPTPKVTISLSETEDNVVVTVEDNGPGIDPEDMEHVFERFYRGRQGGPRHEGTGLGLNIAKAIVTAHGGEIDMESGSEGAMVRVTLPKAAGMRASA